MAIGTVNVGMPGSGGGGSHDDCISKDKLGQINGVATLDENGKLNPEQHPGAVVDVLDSDPISPGVGYMWVVSPPDIQDPTENEFESEPS